MPHRVVAAIATGAYPLRGHGSGNIGRMDSNAKVQREGGEPPRDGSPVGVPGATSGIRVHARKGIVVARLGTPPLQIANIADGVLARWPASRDAADLQFFHSRRARSSSPVNLTRSTRFSPCCNRGPTAATRRPRVPAKDAVDGFLDTVTMVGPLPDHPPPPTLKRQFRSDGHCDYVADRQFAATVSDVRGACQPDRLTIPRVG